MTTEPVKSQHYALIIDEDRDIIIGLMLQAIYDNEEAARHFAVRLKILNLVETNSKFMNEFSEKSHSMGWCKDPDCKVPQKKS